MRNDCAKPGAICGRNRKRHCMVDHNRHCFFEIQGLANYYRHVAGKETHVEKQGHAITKFSPQDRLQRLASKGIRNELD